VAAAAERASAPQLPLYEVAREAYTARYCEPLGRGVLPHEAMLVGATVGMAAAAVTTPLDVVKSRMMVGAAGSAGVGAVVVEEDGEVVRRGAAIHAPHQLVQLPAQHRELPLRARCALLRQAEQRQRVRVCRGTYRRLQL